MSKRGIPAWVYKYEKDYEEGRITKDEILKLENANREASNNPLLKLQSVSRALNALGLSSREQETKPKQEQEASEPITITKTTKPCFGCKYYKNSICEYPHSMFDTYLELSDFDKDFSEGRCKMKEK